MPRPFHALERSMHAYLMVQPPSKERDALLVSIEARLEQYDEKWPPKNRPCKIRLHETDLEKQYPYWNHFLRDGSVCAGCGGYNDYGYGGFLGDLCYRCHQYVINAGNKIPVDQCPVCNVTFSGCPECRATLLIPHEARHPNTKKYQHVHECIQCGVMIWATPVAPPRKRKPKSVPVEQVAMGGME